MQSGKSQRQIYTGIGLAILAALIWSGNFVVARGVYKQIPPISLAFYRWLIASLFIAPFTLRKLNQEKKLFLQNWKYFLWVSFFGMALFNCFIYLGGHYTTAINLALIGTTSSPIFSILLAAAFLKEKITFFRILGLCLCITGILVLLSAGSLQNLYSFRFSKGEWYVMIGAFCFAVYNVLVRKKPVSVHPLNFLFITFSLGTLLLLPAWVWESMHEPPILWNLNLLEVLLYLGIGTSVISYYCWNLSIARLGAARTALFGNLIPVFSSIEASWILGEAVTLLFIISLILVITGLIIANTDLSKRMAKA
jgi:drug/metabolite transporter (DMT)-like permease